MTKQELREFYHCSIQDFTKRFKAKNYEDLREALKDSMKYIARFNLDPNSTKCDITELLFVTKNELLKIAARYNIDIKDCDIMVKSFIANPVSAASFYLKKEDDIFDEIEDYPQSDPNYISFLRRNAQALADGLRLPPYANKYRMLEEKRINALSVEASLVAQLLDSDTPIKSELKRQKANFFEKVLGKTSKEYKAFRKMYKKHFRNPDSPLFGDVHVLKDVAMAYLKHKFPNLEEGKLPTMEQIEALSGKGKARASFCLKIVNAVNEKEALEDKLRDLEQKAKYSIDKFPWENDETRVKSLLEEQLEKDLGNEHAPVVEEPKNNQQNINVEEYDQKYDQLDFHNEQDIFK
jgi:hypothetical protein